MSAPRPDPDALLARVKREESLAGRGRLRIFFGACAGVGKTYAMLTAARAEMARGTDVVIGVVETHGRGDTAALAEGLERCRSVKSSARARRSPSSTSTPRSRASPR